MVRCGETARSCRNSKADFRGAGWNVIKVLWGSGWDQLLANDVTGILRKRMEECVDGEYQDYKSKNGAYVREHFFGKYPELKNMVAHMSDDEIWEMTRGGHDPRKVYAAYKAAMEHKGQPTVILAKTVKGYGMGESGEGQMISHQAKKMNEEALRQFRDRFADSGVGRAVEGGALRALPRGFAGNEVPRRTSRGARRAFAGSARQVSADRDSAVYPLSARN